MNVGALIVAEKEGLVPSVVELGQNDRPSQGTTELVLLKGHLGTAGIEIRIGVEILVAEKLEKSPVELVGSGFHVDHDRPAQAPAEFGWQHVGEHLEFGNGVGIRQHRRLIVVGSVIVDAVQQEVIVLDTVAVDRHQRVLVGGVGSLRHISASRERNELDEVAAVQRQIHHLLGFEHLAERGGFRLQEGRFAHHFDGLLHIADFQSERKTQPVLDVQYDSVTNCAFETFGFHRYRIGPDAKRRCSIETFYAGTDPQHDARLGVLLDLHGSVADRSSACVYNLSGDDAGILLGV